MSKDKKILIYISKNYKNLDTSAQSLCTIYGINVNWTKTELLKNIFNLKIFNTKKIFFLGRQNKSVTLLFLSLLLRLMSFQTIFDMRYFRSDKLCINYYHKLIYDFFDFITIKLSSGLVVETEAQKKRLSKKKTTYVFHPIKMSSSLNPKKFGLENVDKEETIKLNKFQIFKPYFLLRALPSQENNEKYIVYSYYNFKRNIDFDTQLVWVHGIKKPQKNYKGVVMIGNINEKSLSLISRNCIAFIGQWELTQRIFLTIPHRFYEALSFGKPILQPITNQQQNLKKETFTNIVDLKSQMLELMKKKYSYKNFDKLKILNYSFYLKNLDNFESFKNDFKIS